MGCWVACLRWGRKVALVATVLWQLIITSPVVTAIVVCTATSIVTAVVVVAT
jgi:predicted aconitase with swiveling domain